ADHQQVLHVRLRQEVLECLERGGVEPLQIIEKEREWMLWPCEDADESPQGNLKASARILWRKLWNWRLFANDELQLGDEVQQERSVRAQRFPQSFAPGRQLGLALRQKAADETLKGLRQRGIRDVSLVLVELPGRE